MTADGAALLRAVIETPADDAPRLVYADWLDDHGRPAWAEFIRLQVAAAREPCPNTWVPPRQACAAPDCRGCRQFRDRMADLYRQPDLTDAVWAGWNPPVVGVGFDRGFIETAAVAPEGFTQVAGRLFALQPLRSVRLAGRRSELTKTGAVWYSEEQIGLSPAQMGASVPRAVYELMASPKVRGRWIAKVYPTHAEADAALSAGCVAFGRRAAGLG
ncbi:MAG TPA: TIGR02996 domain-containing protein [Gemmataceae bacterium]|jgi:uncharacterized protein (TIGR02996 family)|nr:TIGR02996 domain-containing protein [Gemmataceae bacterium]